MSGSRRARGASGERPGRPGFRFDVPTVGPETIGNLAGNGAGMLVIEGGKTLIIDRRQMIADADRHGIVVLSRTNDSPDG